MKNKFVLLAAVLVLSLVSVSNAALYSGYLSTATVPAGVVGSGGSWSSDFQIRWEVDQVGSTWQYEYWVTRADGTTQLGTGGQQGGLSHWSLEVSPNVSLRDFTWILGEGNEVVNDPTAPAPKFYGVKFEGSDQWHVKFQINRMPVWGDFFAKDGEKGGSVWNRNYGLADPLDPASANATTLGKILRPDSVGTPIPEPGTMLLFGLGAAGVGIVRRFRK